MTTQNKQPQALRLRLAQSAPNFAQDDSVKQAAAGVRLATLAQDDSIRGMEWGRFWGDWAG